MSHLWTRSGSRCRGPAPRAGEADHVGEGEGAGLDRLVERQGHPVGHPQRLPGRAGAQHARAAGVRPRPDHLQAVEDGVGVAAAQVAEAQRQLAVVDRHPVGAADHLPGGRAEGIDLRPLQ